MYQQFAKRMLLPMTFVLLLNVPTAIAQKIAKDLQEAIDSAVNFSDWKPEDSMYPKEDGKLALENGKACIEKIDGALANGLAGSTQVETNKGNMTVTQAREICVRVRDAGQKVFGDLTAAEEAQYESSCNDRFELLSVELFLYDALEDLEQSCPKPL